MQVSMCSSVSFNQMQSRPVCQKVSFTSYHKPFSSQEALAKFTRLLSKPGAWEDKDIIQALRSYMVLGGEILERLGQKDGRHSLLAGISNVRSSLKAVEIATNEAAKRATIVRNPKKTK